MNSRTNSAARGAAWMVSARIAERVLGLGSTIVLARLLAPADFGLVAMAMVFVAAADLLSAFGLDWALVRQPGLARRHLDTAWTIRAGLGLFSVAVLAVLAYPAAAYYREPRISAMILVLGVSLLIGTLENPGVVIFRREMNFAKEFQLRTASKILGATVAITAAVVMRSYWALLLGTLAARSAMTVMSYAIHPHRPRPSLEARQELLGFSIWLWLGNILTFLRVRIIQLILGRIVGPRELGLFTVSTELAELATTELAAPINRALFSAYAQKGQDPVAVGAAYLNAAPVIWAIALPVIVGTFLTADQVVYLMLGPQWGDAAPILRVLALGGLAGLLTTGALHVYWAVNRPRLESLIEGTWVVALLVLVTVLAPSRGVLGAAWAVLLSGAIVAPVNLILLRRYAGVSILQTVARAWRLVVGCAVMFMVVYGVGRDWVPTSITEALRQLTALTLVGGFAYTTVVAALWFLSGRPDGPERSILHLVTDRGRNVERPVAGAPRAAARAEPKHGERPMVSVIVPAFNSERFVGQALASALAQTYRPLEIILVDDGSTDRTAEIARQFGDTVRVLEQPNCGSAAARNRGIDEARGEYIAFLDSDDLWHPAKLELQMAHLVDCADCVGVYCDKIEMRGGEPEPDWSRSNPSAPTTEMSVRNVTSGWLYLELLRDSIVHTSTLVVPREVLARAGRFDEYLRKGQDLDYWLRLSRLGPIHRLQVVLSAYRIHPDSVSHRLMNTNFHAQVVERALRRFGVSDSQGRALERNEASRILALSWFEFAYQHFQHGSLAVSREGICRALEYRPTMLRAWTLGVRATLRSVISVKPGN